MEKTRLNWFLLDTISPSSVSSSNQWVVCATELSFKIIQIQVPNHPTWETIISDPFHLETRNINNYNLSCGKSMEKNLTLLFSVYFGVFKTTWHVPWCLYWLCHHTLPKCHPHNHRAPGVHLATLLQYYCYPEKSYRSEENNNNILI